MLRLGVGARIFLDAELIEQLVFRSAEAESEQHKLGGQHFLGAGEALRHRPAVVLHPLDQDGLDGLQMSVLVAEKLGGLNGVLARVCAPEGLAFLLAVIQLVDFGPLRPGIVGGAGFRRHPHDFELMETAATLPERRADAVGAGVAAANHDYVLALGGNVLAVCMITVEQTLGVGVQELHGKVDALKCAARRLDEEVVRPGGAATKHNGVEVRLPIVDFRFQIIGEFSNRKS